MTTNGAKHTILDNFKEINTKSRIEHTTTDQTRTPKNDSENPAPSQSLILSDHVNEMRIFFLHE